jgi:lipopolysaccharide export system permease protein
MKLLDRLILREVLSPFLNSVLMFIMLLFATAYLFKLTELLVKGVPLWTVVRVVLYSLPALVTWALPMAMLLGCLLAFGRLSSDSEHVALFAGGVSFFRISVPVAVMGGLVSLFAFFWNETVAPPAQRAYYRLVQDAAEKVMAVDTPLSYTLRRDDGGVDLFANIEGGYDARQQMLRKVTLIKMDDDPKRRGMPAFSVYAERAIARDPKGLDWVYYDCRVLDLRPDPNRKAWIETHFEEARTSTLPANVGVRRSFRGVMQSEPRDNRSMTFRQLRDKINSERAEGNLDTGGDEVDLWGKLSMPLASLVFGLVGAPLGVRPHRGSKAVGFGMAIGIIFMYWVIYNWMYVVGKNGSLPPVLAAFSGCIIGLFVAIILIARTRQ